MDSELVALIEKTSTSGNLRTAVKFDGSDEIELKTKDGPVYRALKPLTELYGSGNGGNVDLHNKEFEPLFRAIEEQIVVTHRHFPELTDARVGAVLGTMGMTPEAQIDDRLAERLQAALRYVLSLNNYSRQEVRQAIRKIHKSVDRHTRAEGTRGYLNFIRVFFPTAAP